VSNPNPQQLAQFALQVRQNSYAPYSHYRVGAALVGLSGKIYLGCNVENAAYPVSLCAERVAVFKAVSEGERQFTAIAVATDNAGTPCGSCRQVMAEFALEMPVYLVNGAGEVVRTTSVRELLPGAFLPQDLGIDPTTA
jgi:cytidine deaminase